ncbi:hypothetical protein VN24_04015 [Paenibacillus beijingensis]|uniref:Uncharacterized protein n=1 Tax=Paenibacillus beijingensis TaxID=1126833 RepID=A0A0D5NG82_9BACL|nr:hypothetical protein VN24_04015 [Paenibacillus beijingensis]
MHDALESCGKVQRSRRSSEARLGAERWKEAEVERLVYIVTANLRQRVIFLPMFRTCDGKVVRGCCRTNGGVNESGTARANNLSSLDSRGGGFFYVP